MRFPGVISPQRTRRGGYTLLELMLSAAVLAVLMGAMAFSLGVASKSIDAGLGSAGDAMRAGAVMEEIDADLATAKSFAERTATAVTFTVPDRNGDTSDEQIRYWWAGAQDGRLFRQVNAGKAVVLAEDVRHFALTYGLRTVEASP